MDVEIRKVTGISGQRSTLINYISNHSRFFREYPVCPFWKETYPLERFREIFGHDTHLEDTLKEYNLFFTTK